MLERKWPRRYNAGGHLAWKGRVYAPGVVRAVGRAWRIYQGTWGSALFQTIYEPAPGALQSCTQTPEWYLVVLSLAVLSMLGGLWHPLFAFLPILLASIVLPVIQALVSARFARFPKHPLASWGLTHRLALTAALFALQPAARLLGRLSLGLTPWHCKKGQRRAFPFVHVRELWSQKWRSGEQWLESFESAVLKRGFAKRGGEFDDWDLQIRGGLTGGAQVRLAVEEHGGGRQMLRWRVQPQVSRLVMSVAGCFLVLSTAAFGSGHWVAGFPVGTIALGLVFWLYRDCSTATAVALDALHLHEEWL